MAFAFWRYLAMPSTLNLQFTNVCTRVVDGKTIIALKDAAKNSKCACVSIDWVEMPPEDVRRLIKTLQDTLAKLGPR